MPSSFRPFRLMSSPPSSPRRVFSASKSSLLNALDNSPPSSDGSINFARDPFSQQLTVSIDKATDRDTSCHSNVISSSSKMKRKQAQSQWPPLRLKRGSVVFEAESTDSMLAQPVKRSTTDSSSSAGPTFVRASAIQLAAQLQRKLVSNTSKENSVVSQPTPQLVFDPPLVHPLPRYSYREYKPTPRLVYVRHEALADKLVDGLSSPLGFDLEWKVVFSKGSAQRPAATVQLSDRKTILVIQVSAMKRFPKKLKELLEDPKIAKIGVNIINDGNKLARDYGVYPRGLVELSKLARQADVHFEERYAYASKVVTRKKVNAAATSTTDGPKKKRKHSALVPLSMATAMYTGRELPKGSWVRCGNWEAQPLNEMQLEYAANDAHCALMIYLRLLDLAKASNLVLKSKQYSSDVKPGNNDALPVEMDMTSSMPSKVFPYKLAALYQVPAMAEKISSSSAASTAGYAASSSSSATGSTSISNSLHPRPSQDSAFEPARPLMLQTATKKSIPSVSYADVSDDDVRVLEVRMRNDSTKVKQTTTDRLSSIGPFKSSKITSSEHWQAETRGRTGPRFKPSYDTLPSTRNASRSSSPSRSKILEVLLAYVTKPASASTSKNPSPERSPRFKPSYDTALSRSSSPAKAATLPTVSESEGPRTPAAAPIASPGSSSSPNAPPSACPFASSFSSNEPTRPQPTYQSPQHIRAYNLWHHRQLSLPDICSTLRSKDNPLKTSTVITYVVSALQTDPQLHFSRRRLKELLTSEQASWYYYRDWFHTLNVHKYVNMDVGPGR